MNKKLFKSNHEGKNTKATDTLNEAGGTAYKLSDKAALAQYVCTGCFNSTYYASAEDQLDKISELANKVDVKFLAKLAIYARQNALMKDAPAVLAAFVGARDSDLLASIFDKVIDNPKMLRNFIKVVRSGITGKKSFGTRTKRLIQKYLEKLTDDQLFKADVGNDPSLQDIIKLVHPKPTNKKRSAMYGYLLDKEYNARDLAPLAKEFERFKKEMSGEIPDVPFQMLTALPLLDTHWAQIANNATWTQIRMNLNTFARHNVLKSPEMVSKLAAKLADPEQVKRAKAFPYQLFTTYQNMDPSVPGKLTNAVQDAADAALENVPEFSGKVYIMVDTSGSMRSPITGNRGSVSTKTRCIDVAALFASAILRKNPDAEVIPFDTSVHVDHRLNPRDSIMTNAKTLAAYGGGGTNCSIALKHVNDKGGKGDLVVYISDNESWVETKNSFGFSYRNSTATMVEWNKFKARNPNAKLVNIDIQPSSSTQTHSRSDILNIGGFSDQVFSVIYKFTELGNDADLWISTIEQVKL